MNPFKVFFCLCALVVLILPITLPAQGIRINLVSGAEQIYALNDVRKITFSESNLNMHLNNGSTESMLLSDIRYYAFDLVITKENSPIAFQSNMIVFPNPSNGQFTTNYLLQKEGDVSIELYDLQGKCLSQVVQKDLKSGSQSFTWNGTDGQRFSSGSYICKITSNGISASQKIIIE